MREQALSQILAKLLGVRDGRLDNCVKTSQTGVVEHAGCLGEQVRLCMEATGRRVKGNNRAKDVTLGRSVPVEVPCMFCLLIHAVTAVSTSFWMSSRRCRSGRIGKVGGPVRTCFVVPLLTLLVYAVRELRVKNVGASRSQSAILADLSQGLAPSEVSVLVQIVLRDLSPLLYPPPSPNPSAALLKYTAKSYTVVTIEDALTCWTPEARSLYCAVADVDRVAWAVDMHLREQSIQR